MRATLSFFASWLALVGLCCPLTSLRADEWEQSSSYYENDAWYDITEWFDGNDYNPTDEVAGKWDNEKYDRSALDTDADNDWGSYGYDNYNDDDNWFYDYDTSDYVSRYDYGADHDVYRTSYEYYDFDQDGYYDSYLAYRDTDADGFYEDVDYYSFNDNRSKDSAQQDKADKKHDQADKQKKSSRREQIAGTIEKVKRVHSRAGSDRLVAMVSTKDNRNLVVDLGSASRFRSEGKQADQSAKHPMPRKGDQLTAHGPLVKVGDKQLLIAQSAKLADGQMRSIDRSSRQVAGEIQKLKTVKVRGKDRRLAIVKLDSGKKAAVDLGPAGQMKESLKEGTRIQVNGTPAKVKDRAVILARSITIDGERTMISRDEHKSGSPEKEKQTAAASS